jgi:LytS/YehU family sensor histidine kinase
MKARLPSLILQPIIENAVKHGVAGAPPPSTIAIEASADEAQLVIRVRDSGRGSGTKAKGAGIGLANVRQRLQLVYGPGNADVMAGRVDDHAFQVTLTLPLEIA